MQKARVHEHAKVSISSTAAHPISSVRDSFAIARKKPRKKIKNISQVWDWCHHRRLYRMSISWRQQTIYNAESKQKYTIRFFRRCFFFLNEKSVVPLVPGEICEQEFSYEFFYVYILVRRHSIITVWLLSFLARFSFLLLYFHTHFFLSHDISTLLIIAHIYVADIHTKYAWKTTVSAADKYRCFI